MGSGLPASSLPSRLQPKPGKHLSIHPPTHIFLAASRARLASDEPEPKPHHTLCAACELALLKGRVSQGQATWHGSGNNKVGIYKLVRIFAGCEAVPKTRSPVELAPAGRESCSDFPSKYQGDLVPLQSLSENSQRTSQPSRHNSTMCLFPQSAIHAASHAARMRRDLIDSHCV